MAATTQDLELKRRHRAMWASGDYASIADIVGPLSVHLVEACGVAAGQKVLDVAAGTGSSALPAAALGADVTASDLTPELFDTGRERAAERGLELRWVEADAEALPFDDGEFDVTMSAIGAMFAPHHEAVARELIRVTKPGGIIGMVNWTPESVVGQLFKTMGPYVPPPPPGAQPPPLWGSEEHVRELLGDGCSELTLERHVLDVTAFSTPEEFHETFKTKYGPTIVAFANNADDPERTAALDRDFLAFVERTNLGGTGPGHWRIEYLLVIGRRA